MTSVQVLHRVFQAKNFTAYDLGVLRRCRPGRFLGSILQRNWGSGHPWSLFDGKTGGGAADLQLYLGTEAVNDYLYGAVSIQALVPRYN